MDSSELINEQEEAKSSKSPHDALPSLMRQVLSLIDGPEMDNAGVVAQGKDEVKAEKDGNMSLHGRQSCSSGGKAKKKKFTIFSLPEEVWELILKEVTADKDLESCCRASTYLDMIVTPTKPVWQFKKVVPFVCKLFNQSDFYNCRLVCKQWKEDLDNMVQETPYDQDEIEIHDGGLYPFVSVSTIEGFLEKFADHPGNPFVDRSVFFINEQEPGFEEALIDLVERFGRHIWKLHIRNINLFPLQFYINLQTVLLNCVNLRHFRIDGHVVDMDDVDDAEIQTMGRFILNNPLPFVPSLETLWIRPFPFMDFPDNIHTMMMLPYATQLKSLSMGMSSWKDLYARGLVNLKDIVLHDIPSDEILERLLLVTAPIETMTLTFTAPAIDLLLLMRVISHFPLKTILLIINEGTDIVEPTGERISDLSRIRSPDLYSFDIGHGPKFSYNFLRTFPALRQLSVGLTFPLETYLEGNEESEEDVQFYKMLREGQLYKSNIWRTFPSLEHIKIYDRRFGRENGLPHDLFEYVIGTRNEYLHQRHQL